MPANVLSAPETECKTDRQQGSVEPINPVAKIVKEIGRLGTGNRAVKIRVSLWLSTSILLVTATLFAVGLLSSFQPVHPLFWLALAIGALGIAGGDILESRSLNQL